MSPTPDRPARRVFGRGRSAERERAAGARRVIDELRPADAPRERLLAVAELAAPGHLNEPAVDWVAGTATAVYLPRAASPGDTATTWRRVVWTAIERAHWDSETQTFDVVETDGTRTSLSMADADRFGQLVKERVEASVLVERHVRIDGRRGVRIVGRRDPAGAGTPSWRLMPDAGLDMTDPAVEAAVAAELAAVQDEFGARSTATTDPSAGR